ncbi:hypothetical protein ACVW0P_002539 [Mucilaginibacter sp. UYNi724]
MAGKTQMGNMKLYFEKASGRVFTGNQYTKTIGLAKVGKHIGVGITVGVGIYETNQLIEGKLSEVKYETNRFFDVLGFYGGPGGTLLSVGNSYLNAHSQ